ncbi:glycosyltransferase family 2 protein [Nitrosopumilus sp.]|jgi:GT2 family glycosyltransferase|nr:glycosyltransferase family 2 protein [Nitrosopumilus sp.]
MALSKVSIIIVNYNGKELLKKCLDSLFKIKYDNFEVIIVDNNSTDNTIEFITKNYPSIQILKLDSNKGFAEPNNLAAKITKGDFLLFLNNDTVVTPNFISEMMKILEHDKTIGICQSLLLKPDGSIDSSGDFIDKLGVVYNSKTKIKEIRNISSARGASMLIERKIFNKLGGFDEKFFFSFEDVDLGWRTWILGYKVVIVPNSIVYHSAGTTTSKLKSESAFHGLKNQLAMKITNFEPRFMFRSLFLFFFVYGLREMKIWFDYKFKHNTNMTSTKYEETIAKNPNLKIIIKSVLWIFKNMGYLRKKHIQVNRNRVASSTYLEKIKIISNEKQ